MILVTGGTGFIGHVLIRHLIDAGRPVRALVRPSPKSPNLPLGTPIDVAVTTLDDKRGLRASMVGVDTVFHMVGAEWFGASGDLLETDIQGTQSVVQAAVEAGVKRIFYLSHLGADRASAYPVMKSKAIAEEFIRRSGIDFTIIRTAIIFGKNDHFTTGIARLLHSQPFLFLLPGEGDTVLQPIWVEDLVTCLNWALDDDVTRNQTFEVGGPEYFTFLKTLQMMMEKIGIQRTIIPIRPPYLRAVTVLFEHIFPGLPVSPFWLDYLASDRTCSLDTVPRVFGLMPSRFTKRLDYMTEPNWARDFWRLLLKKKTRSN